MSNDKEVNEDIIWMRRMVSHNVRMPMAIIRGYGDVLRQKLLTETEKQKAIDIICQNIVYLDQTISVIFEDGTAKEVMMIEVDISDVLRVVQGYIAEMARNNGLKVNVITESKEMYIKAELVPIIRIFYQIFENAFKYLDKGSVINISAHTAGDDILIVYKDNGSGIEEDEVARILEKGYRGRNSINKSGSGLGLYEAAEIAKKYNGSFVVKSRKGHGFSVFITFPKSNG